MDNTSHSSSVTLGSQVRRILRHPVLILVSVVVFALAGAAYGYMTNGKYTAKASLVVYPMVVDRPVSVAPTPPRSTLPPSLAWLPLVRWLPRLLRP